MGLSVPLLAALLLVVSPLAWGDLENVVWEIDWNNYDEFDLDTFTPFSSPGVIVDGYTFDGTMKLMEMAWQASSPQEVIGLLCVNYGPTIYGFANAEAQLFNYDPIVDSSTIGLLRETCDNVVTSLKWGTISDIKGRCITTWNQLELGIDANNTLFSLEECYTQAFDGDSSIPIKFQYAMDIMAGVYSTCSGYGLGTDRISSLAFGALDWLGPSLLYAASENPYAMSFGGCSLLRYVLSMDLTDILDQITTLMSYPIADALEYFQYLRICGKLGESVDHSEGFNLIFDLLLTFSGRTSTSMCEFLSTENTRQMYMQEAETIADGMLSTFTDTTVCQDVIAEIATSADAITFLEIVTGLENLNSAAGRKTLCDDITSALETSSADSLESYTLPNGVDINEYQFLSVAGELLPNFLFSDALNFVGAIAASETVTEAVVVYCDVFEDFLVSNEIFYGVDVEELCAFVRDEDLENIETFCLETALADYWSYPLSLRSIDPLMVGGDTLRRLIELDKFSQEDICSKIDNFVVHSNHNLRSVVSFAISTFLKEGLPSANGICQDWNNVICFLGPYCAPLFPYEIEVQENYMNLVEKIEDLILLALGYSTRVALCDDIEDGIETLSGRATDDVVEEMTAKILFVLENKDRCTEVADSLLDFASSEMASDNGAVSSEYNEYIMYMVTGYNTTIEVCDIVSATFPSHGLPRTQISLLLTIISLLAAILTLD